MDSEVVKSLGAVFMGDAKLTETLYILLLVYTAIPWRQNNTSYGSNVVICYTLGVHKIEYETLKPYGHLFYRAVNKTMLKYPQTLLF